MSKSAAVPKTRIILGLILLGVSSYLFFRLFRDPIRQEIQYQQYQASPARTELVPPNHDFALLIPEIGASSTIVPDVDSRDSRVYQRALSRGIAHAQGTGKPGGGKNIFLFAHSSADLLTAERYNSVFYLLHHLVPGDEIKVWYHNQLYTYRVTSQKLTAPSATEYLTSTTNTETLNLMTCWPPGTTLKRLIISAEPTF